MCLIKKYTINYLHMKHRTIIVLLILAACKLVETASTELIGVCPEARRPIWNEERVVVVVWLKLVTKGVFRLKDTYVWFIKQCQLLVTALWVTGTACRKVCQIHCF